VSTSDGIKAKDWGPLHSLVLEQVNTKDLRRKEQCRLKILVHLDRLEKKYGTLPSILATRADYVHDEVLAEQLLRKAYDQAVERRDLQNAVLVADSMAVLQLEGREDPLEAAKWVERLGTHLAEVDVRGLDDEGRGMHDVYRAGHRRYVRQLGRLRSRRRRRTR
jgi:hypothetical protein